MIHRAAALAHPNIALAKYWGKIEDAANMPAVPSVSVTLAGLATRTEVIFDDALRADELTVNGERSEATRVSTMLDRVRSRAGMNVRARVTSTNDFPTSSGLASSASAFAALALASTLAADLHLDPDDLSDLARRSSVSAARSVFGGFVELAAGTPGATVLAATELAPPEHWDLRVVVAVTREGPKEIGSTTGMLETQRTSPYYSAWVEAAPSTAAQVHGAILARDFEALGTAAEASALRMHAAAMAASPALVYWNGATLDALAEVRRLRAGGIGAFATIDAGPHLKAITLEKDAAAVAAALAEVPGVLRVIEARPGLGARDDPGDAP
jgi:diphosphomevalonate decarboxylase